MNIKRWRYRGEGTAVKVRGGGTEVEVQGTIVQNDTHHSVSECMSQVFTVGENEF